MPDALLSAYSALGYAALGAAVVLCVAATGEVWAREREKRPMPRVDRAARDARERGARA